MRRHPKDARVPHLSKRTLRDIASQLARIDSLHRTSPTAWVAVAEICHDEMLGRRLLIPVAEWMCVPNVAQRYVVELMASPDRVHLSYRYDPEYPRTCHIDLTIDGWQVDQYGVAARAFTDLGKAEAWLRDVVATG